MHKNFLGWSLESVGKGTVETKYTVEYIDDSKIADELDRTGDPALFTIRAFDNVAEALTYYLRWFVDDSCIIVHLWEQVYVNGEMVLEQMVEPTGYAKNAMRNVIDKEMENRMNTAERESSELRESNELYRKFIKKFGKQTEEMFAEFVRETKENEQ